MSLILTNVSKSFGALHATRNVSMTVKPGGVHALIGPNGAGKTTLLSLITGQLAPDSGSIAFEGQELVGQAVHRRARLGLARSFQISSVFLPLTVRENLVLALRGHKPKHLGILRPTMRDRAVVAQAEALASRFALADDLDRLAGDLSHGGRRRVELAMTIALGPKAVLLDEPLAGLGADEIDVVSAVITAMAEKSGAAVLLIEHDMDSVFRLADRLTLLVDGAILAEGSPEQMRANAEVQAAYLC